MSLTISELESERAKILDEIESKAKSISQPNNSNNPQGASLNDWLTAAEEVMPEKPRAQSKSNYSSKANQSLHSNRTNSKASFFGVVIMLSLFLTILGVLYIAYTSIHKELQTVMAVKDENIEQMKQLQANMQSLQQAVAAGGKSELFAELEQKVTSLESQVEQLQQQLKDGVAVAAAPVANTTSTESSAETAVTNSSDNVVTEAVLDEKLKTYTQQLESKIDRKLEVILQYLTSDKPVADNILTKPEPEAKPAVEETKPAEDMVVETPEVSEAKEPVITTPLVKLVTEVKQPAKPAAPAAPIANATEDVKWLMDQPKPHYILQLASMPEVSSLKKIVDNKALKETKILPQTRGDITNYVLVTGSFASRDQANKLAKQIKADTGISPWVRKVKDLAERVK